MASCEMPKDAVSSTAANGDEEVSPAKKARIEPPPRKPGEIDFTKDIDLDADLDEDEDLADEEDGFSDKLLTEADVGITEFISEHDGFNGVIKQRFSDFLVNEISLSDDVVEITDLSVPPNEDPEAEGVDDVLTEAQKAELAELVRLKDIRIGMVIPCGDKEKRRKIHAAVRQYQGLQSTTEARSDGSMQIEIIYKVGRAPEFTRRWPANRGNYCHFVLYKEIKDTMGAVNFLRKLLRRRVHDFSFAGTKDRRAKTSQMVSAYRVQASSLQKLNDRLNNIVLGNFKYCDKPLKLGDLKGNHFTIILRNVTGTDEQIAAGINSLMEKGFINYYGMQRFGTTSIPTHHVGRALLQNKWMEAIELILKPREGDHKQIAAARKAWWETRDPVYALHHLPYRHCLERSLLEGLARFAPTDCVNALNMVSRNARLMYVHAYQSYIWNCVASRRVREFGLEPIIGDLVLPKQERSPDKPKTHPEPTKVTAENISQYSVWDLVLPLPGHLIIYPDNEVGKWFHEMLAADNLDETQLKNKVKDYSLPGDYRHLVHLPDDIAWEVMHYDDVMLPLILSDCERMKGVQLPEPVKEGKFKALKLEFSLPSSCYATMAIREVIKADTSAGFQATLNTS